MKCSLCRAKPNILTSMGNKVICEDCRIEYSMIFYGIISNTRRKEEERVWKEEQFKKLLEMRGMNDGISEDS